MPHQTNQLAETATLREAVRARYASAAAAIGATSLLAADNSLRVLDAGCCSPTSAEAGCCEPADKDIISRDLYSVDEVAELPSAAVLASLGCGNPTALAELRPGMVVLDLGSGGGIDVLLSARRVGPSGFAYGLDMTDEMLALAQQNASEQRVRNVAFLKGEIEHIPLPDASVDVVISNCVINLSADKPQVLREAFRVLRPGGRFAVSDVVVQGTLPTDLRRSMELWAGCIAGALEDDMYRRLLAEAGFADIGIEVTRVYGADDLASSSCCAEQGPEQIAAFAEFDAAGGRLVSAFVRATRPGTITSVETASSGSTDCCSSTEQATCCAPTDKAACCGNATSAGCGCHA